MKLLIITLYLQTALTLLLPPPLHSEGKIAHCLTDLTLLKTDAMDIYKMIKEKYDSSILTAKLLDIALKAQDMQNRCKSIDTSDIMEYVKEEMKGCFDAIQGLGNDFWVLFGKRDVTVEDVLEAGRDFYERVPLIVEVCGN